MVALPLQGALLSQGVRVLRVKQEGHPITCSGSFHITTLRLTLGRSRLAGGVCPGGSHWLGTVSHMGSESPTNHTSSISLLPHPCGKRSEIQHDPIPASPITTSQLLFVASETVLAHHSTCQGVSSGSRAGDSSDVLITQICAEVLVLFFLSSFLPGCIPERGFKGHLGTGSIHPVLSCF